VEEEESTDSHTHLAGGRFARRGGVQRDALAYNFTAANGEADNDDAPANLRVVWGRDYHGNLITPAVAPPSQCRSGYHPPSPVRTQCDAPLWPMMTRMLRVLASLW
jgi:hypothetical protein